MINDKFEFDLSKFSKLHQIAKKLPDILSSDLKELEIEPLLDKIFVSRPYFAFEKIYQFEDVLIAPITTQQKIEFELTPMSSAEAGRHLAILGSCSLAVNENEKNYYLASKAFKRTVDKFDSPIDKIKRLYVISNIESCGKIDCSANTALLDENGKIIFVMNIFYQKLSEKLFNRVFKDHLRKTNYVDYNPYAVNPICLENVVESGNILYSELPVIKDEYCAGHFYGAPMLPVGIMSYIITNCIGKLLKKIDNQNKNTYYLLEAELRLFEPTNNRNVEYVEIVYEGKEEEIHNISWVVKNKLGNIRNTMKLKFVSK